MADKTITITFDGSVCHAGAPQHANNGDKIEWENQTGDEVIVFWPHDNVFGQGTRHFEHQVQNHKKHSPGTVHGQAKGSKLRYAVYCSINQHFAEGNSNPEIVIDT